MNMIKDKFFYLKLYQHSDESSRPRTCFCCSQVIESGSWFYVGKEKRNPQHRLFHKFCGESPMEMTHPLHPHRLKLTPHFIFTRSCSLCNGSCGPTFMYSCESCNFNVDLVCARDETLKLLLSKSPEERERMALKDLSHHHPLKLTRIQTRPDDDDGNADGDGDAVIQQCKACLQPIIDSTYYTCMEESEGCNEYFLHRFCGDLPVEMKHELHPFHPLMLILSPPEDHFKCFACRKLCKGHIYSCRGCSFQLHIICATTASRVLEHKCHLHPLTLIPMSNSSLFCSACCRVHEGVFYQCNVCVVFFIHHDCASLEYVIDHPSHQGHPLRLGCHSDGTQKRNDCDICYQKISDEIGWFYACWECKFYSHLNCIMSVNDEKVQEIDPETPYLPFEEADNEFGTVGLLDRNMAMIQNGDDKASDMDRINHFSHPEHPLILRSDVPREANPYSDGEMTLTTQCNGCCKQISAPLYSCLQCLFYIHKSCALLPLSTSQHHAHSENHQCKLVLLRKPWNETRVFRCGDCRQYCNGFSYQCEQESCSFEIDVECAFLPGKIVHKAHPIHNLSLVINEKRRWLKERYKCCWSYYSSSYAYMCRTCGFLIHTECAMYPVKAQHRFDCDSPFMLNFNPGVIEPNEYHYCIICERQLNPKLWFYFSSKDGGQIMHSECILLTDKVAGVHPKFKSTSSLFEVDMHPHPLHLYPIFSSDNCYHCQMKMEDHDNNATHDRRTFYFAYQCVEWDCRYQIHLTCGNKFIINAQEATTQGTSTVAYNIQKLCLDGTGGTGLRGNMDNLATRKGKEIIEQ